MQFASGPIRKVGGGAVHFRSDTKSGGGGGGVQFASGPVRYEKWGEGVQFASGPIREKWGALFGAQQIRYR